MKKNLLSILTVLMTLPTIASCNNSEKVGATSMVVMDVNPSISFTLDANGKVTSVNGENEEGEVIIADENIVGLNIEEAIELVLTIETETGFIVTGNAKAEDNSISFTLNVDDEKAKEKLNKMVNDATNKTLEKLDVNGKVEMAKAYTNEKLNELVLACDPSYTEDELAKLSYEQKLDAIKLYNLETAEMYSKELEDLYNQVKYYEISFATSSYSDELISNLSGTYAIIYATVSKLLDEATSKLEKAIDEINTLRYNLFVSEDSTYQKVYDEFKKNKENVLVLTNQIASDENASQNADLMAALNKANAALEQIDASLVSSKQAGIDALDAATKSINSVIDSINSIKEKIISSEELSAMLKEKASEYDAYLNTKKSEIFNDFEAKYKEDIENSKKEALAYKNELKQKVSEARA